MILAHKVFAFFTRSGFGAMKIAFYETSLTDFQWRIIEPLLPKPAKTGRPPVCLRSVCDAILYMVKCGCPWRLLPNDFPAWRTVYGHFRKWTISGLVKKIHHRLRDTLREFLGRDKTPSAGIIDSQTVRSAAHGGVVGFDAGKKTKGRKRFLCVDTLGYIIDLFVCPADQPERAGAKNLLAPTLKKRHLGKLWADGGFSGQEFADWVKETGHGTDMEIVRRCDSARGFKVLPKRWVVERTFGWLMHHRRLVRDYEKTVESAEAFVFLAATRIMLNQFC